MTTKIRRKWSKNRLTALLKQLGWELRIITKPKLLELHPWYWTPMGPERRLSDKFSLDNSTSGSDFQVFFACVSFWSVVSFKSHPTYLSFCGKIWGNCHFNEIHRWNLCIPVKFSFSSELSWLMSAVDVLSLLKATPLVCLSVAKSEGIVISRWNKYLSNLSSLLASFPCWCQLLTCFHL